MVFALKGEEKALGVNRPPRQRKETMQKNTYLNIELFPVKVKCEG